MKFSAPEGNHKNISSAVVLWMRLGFIRLYRAVWVSEGGLVKLTEPAQPLARCLQEELASYRLSDKSKQVNISPQGQRPWDPTASALFFYLETISEPLEGQKTKTNFV